MQPLEMHFERSGNLVVPGRVKAEVPPPLSFRAAARNLVAPVRAKAEMLSPAVNSSKARNLIIPARARAEISPPLSFRAVARNLVVPDGRSLPCGRDDSRRTVEMTAGDWSK